MADQKTALEQAREALSACISALAGVERFLPACPEDLAAAEAYLLAKEALARLAEPQRMAEPNPIVVASRLATWLLSVDAEGPIQPRHLADRLLSDPQWAGVTVRTAEEERAAGYAEAIADVIAEGDRIRQDYKSSLLNNVRSGKHVGAAKRAKGGGHDV